MRNVDKKSLLKAQVNSNHYKIADIAENTAN